MVSAKWVFSWKANEHGKVVKAEAPLVSRGFNRHSGVDYYETFAPTPAASCIRMVAAIAGEVQLDLGYFDVQQTFRPGRTPGVSFDADATGLWRSERQFSALGW